MQRSKASASASRQKQYARLRAQLAHLGWISQGSLRNRGPGAGGACYPWTRKVKGKTVCVALSKEQYEWLKQAIAHWRALQKTLRQRQRLSREELFLTRDPVPRAERNSARRFSDWFEWAFADLPAIQCHREGGSSKIGRPPKTGKERNTEENDGPNLKNRPQITAKMSDEGNRTLVALQLLVASVFP